MGDLKIKNLYGADIEITSKCSICGKDFIYRLRERKTCGDDACYEESKKRRERGHNRKD